MEKNGTLNRIVNGKNADPNEWPWLAAIVSFHHKRSSFLKEKNKLQKLEDALWGDMGDRGHTHNAGGKGDTGLTGSTV